MKVLIVLLILIFTTSCSSAEYQEKAFNKRIYSHCKSHYKKGNFTVLNPEKKYCRHYCVKWKFFGENTTKNCKKWKLEKLDKEENHERFRSARMIILNIDEYTK